MRVFTVAIGVLLLGALAVPSGCDGLSRRGGAKPNVLLITVDALRADHVGAYGNGDIDTPVLDRLAREGVLFQQASAQVPLTVPSHASLFTARNPLSHGVRDNGSVRLPDTERTLAEILVEAGSETGAVVGTALLNGHSGLQQGFEFYDDVVVRATKHPAELQRGAEEVTERALAWLRERRQRGSGFFLWAHYFDPHEPHAPPAPYDELYREAPYDGEIAFVDEAIGGLLDGMREMGLHEDTLVVVTSPHGEGLGEHGERGHGFLVHQATLHVPLIWWRPGVLPQGRVVEDPVRSIDIVPTLLDLLELPPKPDADGTTLLPRLGPSPKGGELEVYGESMAAKLRFGHSPLRSLRIGDWKYVLDLTPELYQLGDDPRELQDLSGEKPERAAELRRRLLALVGRAARAQDFEADPQPSGKDPVDTIRVVNLIAQGESYRENRKWRKAGDSFREVLALDPGNELARVYLAWLQADQGNIDRAVTWLNHLRPLSASRPSRMQGELYLKAQAWERAAAVFQHLAEREPHNAWAHYNLGQAYQELGAQAEAIHAFERAIESEPALSDAHAELAGAYLEQGQTDRALEAYRAALALLPDSSEYHEGLGRALQAKASCREAVGAYRKAAELDIANLAAIESSGLCLLRVGDVEAAADYAWQILRGTSNSSLALVIFGARRTREGLLDSAVSMLEKAIELDPESTDAWYYLAVAQARQDDLEPALTSLETAFTLGSGTYESLAREEEAFAPLADEPRFQELLSPSDS